jgi:penicillin-binding protein 1A
MYIFTPKNSASSSKAKKFWDRINWKLLGKVGLGIALAGVLSVAGVFAYFAKDLPSPGKLNERQTIQSTKIFDRTGNHLLYEVHGEEKRTEIPFSEVPDTLKFATIALEDQDFYNHHGIKLTGIARAALKDNNW